VENRDAAKTLRYLSRLVDVTAPRKIVVIGCGHRPKILRQLLDMGHDAVGVEPVEAYVQAAGEYLGRTGVVLRGAAEDIPLPSNSQDIVLFENVLEHVDSVSHALNEIYRVTAPGGVAHVKTNSRLHVSATGMESEFRVRFYTWLPSILKESYIHHHLHFKPSLANYSTRPAVHWFDYGELCRVGREAGFARFYSLLDVVDRHDPAISGNLLRGIVVNLSKYHPWLRALALTQIGGYIYMYKRPRDA